jgi:surface polysaccharide O-acyltransferase-like enzyme
MAEVRRSWESVAGIWKLACALAILVGHNLVTLTQWHPHDELVKWSFRLLQIFSPFQFFFFSGYLASSMLSDSKRSLGAAMTGRFLRVYVLVVGALVWALAIHAIVRCSIGDVSLGSYWPLGVWDQPLSPMIVLRHLDPLGFVDTTKINYATWYLYQELRLILLIPMFRWILKRPSRLFQWGALLALLVVPALLENRFWMWFPLFRTSPFQTMGFAAIFLAGALIWRETRPDGRLSRLPRVACLAAIVAGLAISALAIFEVQLPFKNPILGLLPILAAQTCLFVGLRGLAGGLPVPPLLRKACDSSVGIYVMHPPIHIVAAWLAIRFDSVVPILGGILVSLGIGWLFHRRVELPSQGWVRAIQAKFE